MVRNHHPLVAPPDTEATDSTLRLISEILGEPVCWVFQRRYHFKLPRDGWTLAITPESAGRFRVESCHWTVPTCTLWILASDTARLAEAVTNIAEEVEVAHGEVRP